MPKDTSRQAPDWAHERQNAQSGQLPSLDALREYATHDHVRAIGNMFFEEASGTGEAFILFNNALGCVHNTLYIGTEYVNDETAHMPMTHTHAVKILATFEHIYICTCTHEITVIVGCDSCLKTAEHIAHRYRSLMNGV